MARSAALRHCGSASQKGAYATGSRRSSCRKWMGRGPSDRVQTRPFTGAHGHTGTRAQGHPASSHWLEQARMTPRTTPRSGLPRGKRRCRHRVRTARSSSCARGCCLSLLSPENHETWQTFFILDSRRFSPSTVPRSVLGEKHILIKPKGLQPF